MATKSKQKQGILKRRDEPSSIKPPVVKAPNLQDQKTRKEEETYQWQPEPSAPAPTYSYEEVEAQEPSAPTPPPPVRVTETPSPVATPPAPATTKPTYSPTAQQLTAHWMGAGQNQPATDREGIGGTRVPQGTMITSTPSAANETGRKRDEEALFTYDGKSAERTPTPPSGGYTYQPAETPPTESKPETSYGVKPQAATARPKTGVEAAFERQALEAERRGGFRSDADIMSAFENALTTPRSGSTEPPINLNNYLSTPNYSDMMNDSQRRAVNELVTRYANDHPEILTDQNRLDMVQRTMISNVLGGRTPGQTEPTKLFGRSLDPNEPIYSRRQVQPVQEQGQQTYQYSEPASETRTPAGPPLATQAQGNTPDHLKPRTDLTFAQFLRDHADAGEKLLRATVGNGTQAGQWSGKESDLPKGAVVFTPSYGQDRAGQGMAVGIKLPWREEGYSEEELRHYKQIPARYDANRRDPNTFFGKYNWFEGYYRAPNGRYYPIGSGRQGKGSGPFQRIYANGGPSGGASGSGNAGGGQPSQTVRELDRYYNINKNWSF